MIKEYKIIIELDIFRLEKKIKEMIEDWWQPFGSLSTRKSWLGWYEYVQPMVKYDS